MPIIGCCIGIPIGCIIPGYYIPIIGCCPIMPPIIIGYCNMGIMCCWGIIPGAILIICYIYWPPYPAPFGSLISFCAFTVNFNSI